MNKLNKRTKGVLISIVLFTSIVLSGCISENPNEWAFKLIQINKMKRLGFNGKGVRIGIVDTGIDLNQGNFDKKKFIAWLDLINGKKDFYDDNGHGTFIAALLFSRGGTIFGENIEGICPGCEVVVVKALSDIGETNDTIISKAIDFCIQNDVDIILLSLYKDPEAIDVGEKTLQKCNEAIEKGIFVVAPAGDDGMRDDGDVFEIASIDGVISVGSINQDLYVSSFSSKGNQAFVAGKHEARKDPDKKPEVVAPGEGIKSIYKGAIVERSGTSISASLVAGSLTLLLEAYPELSKSNSDTIEMVKEVLAETAKRIGSEDIYWGNGLEHNDRYGYGLIQVYDAYIKLGEIT